MPALLPSLVLVLSFAAPVETVLRGRVTTAAGAPVAAADVVATATTGFDAHTTRSDSMGTWRISFSGSADEYVVRVTKAGFVPVTRRVRRGTTDSVLVVDVRLVRSDSVPTLAPVVVRAARPRPDRLPPRDAEVGASETFGTDPDLLNPLSAGDLTAAGAQSSDILSTSGGLSVLGMGAAQNATTLNGMAFGATQIPRDVRARVRISTSSYDPSVGWFSGARTNVQLAPGGVFTSRSISAAVDPTVLQARDPVATGFGQRASAADVSVAGDGPLIGPFTYNAGLQVTHRVSDPASLASADPTLLRHAGVAPDSATRLVQLLGVAGIPLGDARTAAAANDHVVLLGRIDHAPYDWATLQPARTTWAVTGFGDLTRQQAVGRTVTSAPAHAGRRERRIGYLDGEFSRYFTDGALVTLRSGVSAERIDGVPYLRQPGGVVRVASDLAAGGGGLSSLAFGGNGALLERSRRWTWESAGELLLHPRGAPSHRLKFAADARLDGFADDVAADRLGVFSFNTLADLEANRPSAYGRMLGSALRHGKEWNAFVSAGDLWRAGEHLQVLYGIRAEGSAFVGTPTHNADVERVFGRRTDRAPGSVGLSPRFGFTLDVPGASAKPAGTVRGGAGLFRNLLDVRAIGGPMQSTGLLDGLTRLSCVGAAAPGADWRGYADGSAAPPIACANGVDGRLSDASPDVQLLDPSLRPPQSWRGNLAWSSSVGHFGYTVGTVYSLDRRQAMVSDLNFAGVRRFTLEDEGRPMFVSPASIVAATGLVSPVESRRFGTFGRVESLTSDLRALSRQLSIRVWTPPLELPGNAVILENGVSYTLASRRVEQLGFGGGSTFDDPTRREWVRGDLDVRHRLVAQALFLPFGTDVGVGLRFAAQAQSGLPFTPMVAGDVNGDGLANDRAFVHDAAAAPGMTALLASASPRVRRCLVRQSGRAAGANSCEGPWSASLSANLELGKGEVPLLPSGTIVRLGFANVLGGLDQLLHGVAGLRGWGTMAVPDPVLYSPRGFDAASQRFRYDLNPRFGDTRVAATGLRAPFRVTLDVHVDISPSNARQQLDRWLQPGRSRPGARLRTPELARRLARNVPDPYAELLVQSDSVLLTAAQVALLRQAQRSHRASMDSIWTRLALYLDSLPDRYDARGASSRTNGAILGAWEVARRDVQRQLRAILTPTQLAALGGTAGQLWSAQSPIRDVRFVP